MSLADLFKAKENAQLKSRISELESMLTPELRDLDNVRKQLQDSEKDIASKKAEIGTLNTQIAQIQAEIQAARQNLVETNEAVLMQGFGLYEPRFDFTRSDAYK